MSVFSTALMLVIVVCLIVFFPQTQNSNLVKEIVWWTALFLLLGVWLISSHHREIVFVTGRLRFFYRRYRWLLILFMGWLLWNAFTVVNARDADRALFFFARQPGYLLTGIVIAVAFSNLQTRRRGY